MQKTSYFLSVCLLILGLSLHAQEEYLKIDANVTPDNVRQGKEAVLKIKITPRTGIKISSYHGFMIKLDDNPNLSFPKVFFTDRELDINTIQEKDVVYLELEKEIPIIFKVKDTALIGKQKISGEVVFTAVFKDNWSLKTYQKFNTDFSSKKKRRNLKRK